MQLTPDERSFLTCLFRAAGLDVERYKTETLKRRLPACLRVARCADVGRAARVLRHNAPLRAAALSALVIGVTHFFRDAPAFAAIMETVLPSLAERTEIRVCSVGCSDGAELYSVAMLLAERGLLGRSTLRGIDCRADAIAHARAGHFDDRAMEGVPPRLLARYFTVVRSMHRVDPALSDACDWVVADALGSSASEPADWLSGRWDIILCRNLRIYLQPTAAAQLCRRLESALRPGGVLVLGKAERPMGMSSSSASPTLHPIGPCLYRRAYDAGVAVPTAPAERSRAGAVSKNDRFELT